MKKIKKIFLILLIMLGTIIFVIGAQKRILNNDKIAQIKGETTDNFSIVSTEGTNIVITVERKDGIKQIEKPNGGIINCNNKKVASFDYQVEKDNNYIFKITDSNGKQVEEIVYVPNFHIEITKNKLDVVLDDLREDLKKKLWNNGLATNYMTIGIGEEKYMDTQSTDMATVFDTWSSFGDGVWRYDSTNKYIYNTKNTEYFTGYYSPENDYNDIQLEFEAKTTDSDDDMIGAMVRFNRSGTNYNSYLFLLDNHESSGNGVSNGKYNGLNKVINKNLAKLGHNTISNITKLSVNSSLKWTRNEWQKYKLIAKGNSLQAYIDDKLVSTVTDDSISSGAYGFVCLSQAMTYFRDIKITTNKENKFEDIINSITWSPEERNIVIKFNNESEAILNTENVINLFNNNNMHYIGVGNDANQADNETFIKNISNRGFFINGTLEIDEILDNIAVYIDKLIKGVH